MFTIRSTGLVLALVAAANVLWGCSDDSSPIRCGAGTRLVGRECSVPEGQGGAAGSGSAVAGSGDAAGEPTAPPQIRCGLGTVLVGGECVSVGGDAGNDGLIDEDPRLGAGGQNGAPPVTGCVAAPALAASNGSCVSLGGSLHCNPVTAGGCKVGELCVFDYSDASFRCREPASEPAPACSACGLTDDIESACAPGFTCAGTLGGCERFCCGDGDCAPGTTCTMQKKQSFGLCQELSDDVFASGRLPVGGASAGGSAGGTF